MRFLGIMGALTLLSACGQSDSGATATGAAGGSGNSATITEGTISDAMIDLSDSEAYGVTSTADESAIAAPAADATAKPPAAPKVSGKGTPTPAAKPEPKAGAPKATGEPAKEPTDLPTQ